MSAWTRRFLACFRSLLDCLLRVSPASCSGGSVSCTPSTCASTAAAVATTGCPRAPAATHADAGMCTFSAQYASPLVKWMNRATPWGLRIPISRNLTSATLPSVQHAPHHWHRTPTNGPLTIASPASRHALHRSLTTPTMQR